MRYEVYPIYSSPRKTASTGMARLGPCELATNQSGDSWWTRAVTTRGDPAKTKGMKKKRNEKNERKKNEWKKRKNSIGEPLFPLVRQRSR